jgi:hypothetical protein
MTGRMSFLMNRNSHPPKAGLQDPTQQVRPVDRGLQKIFKTLMIRLQGAHVGHQSSPPQPNFPFAVGNFQYSCQ